MALKQAERHARPLRIEYEGACYHATVTTSTIGTNMRYTINGAPPTSTTGTLISASSWPVKITPSPGGTILQVIAYKAGMIDSQVHEAVFYYENDNGGNGNMPNPGDGGPGGGGILIDGGDQPTISYDANGNLIHYKEWNYRYDAQNRLTEAWNGTTTAEFYYDGKNRQIARKIGGDIRFSSWDSWELLEEYGSGLTVAKGYLQGATGVIKSWGGNGTLYYYQDKLGSTTHVANGGGQLLESYKYDLYGTPSYFSSTSQPPQPLNQSAYNVADLYAGERWIPELALYDLRNRFMSPELGRFLQSDPIGFKGDASNLYRYCGNDPVDGSDPMGLQDEKPLHLDRIWDRQTWLQGGSNLSFANLELKKSEASNSTRDSNNLSQYGADGYTPSNSPTANRFVPNVGKDKVTAIPVSTTHANATYEHQFKTFDAKRKSGAGYTVLEHLRNTKGKEAGDKQRKERPLQSNGIFPDRVGLDYRPSRGGTTTAEHFQTFEVKYNGRPVDVSTVLKQHVVEEANGEVHVTVTIVRP